MPHPFLNTGPTCEIFYDENFDIYEIFCQMCLLSIKYGSIENKKVLLEILHCDYDQIEITKKFNDFINLGILPHILPSFENGHIFGITPSYVSNICRKLIKYKDDILSEDVPHTPFMSLSKCKYFRIYRLFKEILNDVLIEPTNKYLLFSNELIESIIREYWLLEIEKRCELSECTKYGTQSQKLIPYMRQCINFWDCIYQDLFINKLLLEKNTNLPTPIIHIIYTYLLPTVKEKAFYKKLKKNIFIY